jgi:hypothetical protein
MRKQLPMLASVRVASPCPARWEDMEGNERKRYCSDCKLIVFNLSDMTSQEAESFLRSATGRVCAHYYQRPDGTILTRDCPRGLAAVRRRFALCATSVASLILFTGLALARGMSREATGILSIDEIKSRVRKTEPFVTLLGPELSPPPPAAAIRGRMMGEMAAPTTRPKTSGP